MVGTDLVLVFRATGKDTPMSKFLESAKSALKPEEVYVAAYGSRFRHMPPTVMAALALTKSRQAIGTRHLPSGCVVVLYGQTEDGGAERSKTYKSLEEIVASMTPAALESFIGMARNRGDLDLGGLVARVVRPRRDEE